MCWQDVQISRQTTLKSTRASNINVFEDAVYQPSIERVRLIVSAYADPGSLEYPFVIMATGTDPDAVSKRVLICPIFEPVIIDIDQWGDVLRQRFVLRIRQATNICECVVSEFWLLDPRNEGNPLTKTGGR